MLFRLLLIAALLLTSGTLRAENLDEKSGFAPKLLIYLAKGEPNACGPGCDHWIAIEGTLDSGAALRVRRFLLGVKDTRLPIYLYSPGGAVEQSYVIGRLLRNRKALARIGRTLAKACAAGTQIDSACLKIKTAGGEIQAELTTHRAMCNSACGFIFLGATTREVAPDAGVAVHSSKFTLLVRGHISAQQIEEARARGIAKGNRERAAYIVAMGISHELDDLIATVKFENPHTLTRAELYRFGVDTRPLSETVWTLENAPRAYVHKIAFEKTNDGAFRTMEWRLYCYAKDHAILMFAREFSQGGSGMSAVMMMAGPQRSVVFGQTPARVGSYDVWNNKLAPDLLNALLAADHLQIGESTATLDGTNNLSTFEIDTGGLQTSWAQLVAACPAVPSVAWPVKPWPVKPSPVTPSPGLTSAHVL